MSENEFSEVALLALLLDLWNCGLCVLASLTECELHKLDEIIMRQTGKLRIDLEAVRPHLSKYRLADMNMHRQDGPSLSLSTIFRPRFENPLLPCKQPIRHTLVHALHVPNTRPIRQFCRWPFGHNSVSVHCPSTYLIRNTLCKYVLCRQATVE
jgi:hypothetical protein